MGAKHNELQDKLNPASLKKPELETEKTVYRLGDRVMQITNNYEREWIKDSREQGTGVFNGDIGVITSISRADGCMTVMFDDNRLATYTDHDLDNLQLAYAITIHKSQGSEFPVVVVPLVNGPPTIINKNLLYTAITRAKKMVVLVGSKKILALMVHNNYIAARTTNLCRFLQQENAVHQKHFGSKKQPTDDDFIID